MNVFVQSWNVLIRSKILIFLSSKARWISFCFVLVISGCSSSTQPTKTTEIKVSNSINYSLFDIQDIAVTSEEQIFSLSPAQQNEFLIAYNKSLLQGILPHKAVELFLINRMSDFTYYGETYNAEQAMRLKKGNCMSLAILTTALLKLVDLEFEYREVNTMPVFTKKNNLILTSSHVQTIIYQPGFVPEHNIIYISRPRVIIDYFPVDTNIKGRKFSYQSFIGMYYRNIASDALVDGDLNRSFAYAIKAHQMDPDSTRIVNLLAVLHRRKSDVIAAEKLYKDGLESDENNISLLSNFIVLLESLHRYNDADEISGRLSHLNDLSPYNWLEQAYIEQDKNNYNNAIKYYQKVLALAPYVNEAYMGLYTIYSIQGHELRARDMLKQALEWTYEITERKLYKYKLYSLENSIPYNHTAN